MAKTQPRNVLILIADDWSPLAGCYGNDVIRTPNIDRLAERSTVFDYAFCNTPSCAVSRASLLTGLYSHQHGQYGHCHGIHGFSTHDWVRSVPAALRDAGVQTAIIGKQHIAPDHVYPFHVREPQGNQSAKVMADALTKFIDGCDGKPFFAHVASGTPHRMGQGFGNDEHPDDLHGVDYDPDAIDVPGFLPDHPDVRGDLAEYYKAVTRYDTFIGRCLDALEASGRAEETLVFVMTDHAMPFPGAKASSYDTGHRCPLIVHRPGRNETVRSDALVNWVDVAPTIYDWLGVTDEKAMEGRTGRSLLPILDQSSPDGWEQTYFSHCFHEVTNYFPYRVLRSRRYKFVRNLAYRLEQPLPTDLFRSPTWQAVLREDMPMLGERHRRNFLYRGREELYDLDADPMETTNRINAPELQPIAVEMRRQLTAFREQTRDPWLEVDFQEGGYEGETFG